MNIFDYLRDIIQTKSDVVYQDDEELAEFNSYLCQRWLSMYSPEVAHICNETTNRMWRSMETKQMWYKMFQSLIPRQRNKRIQYIKKSSKKKVQPNKEVIEIMANTLEVSKRECKMYIDEGLINLEQLKEELNIK